MLDITAVVSSLFIVSFLSILMNSFSLYVIITARQFRKKPSSILVLNLLITHLFQAVFVFPLYAGKKLKVDNLFWVQFFSDGFLFTYILSYYGVCFGVLKISIDRFLATYLLNRYKVHVTVRSVALAVTVSWIYVFLLSLIPFIPKSMESSIPHNTSYVKNHSENSYNISYIEKEVANHSEFLLTTMAINITALNNASSYISDYPTNGTTSMSIFQPNLSTTSFNMNNLSMCNYSITMATVPTDINITLQREVTKVTINFYNPQKEWTVFMLFVNAALPLVVIIMCYLYIIYRLKKLDVTLSENKSSNENGRNGNMNSSSMKPREFKRYKDVTYLTLVLSITYSIFWSPSIIYYNILTICHRCFASDWDNSKLEKHIVYIIKYLSFINSLFSPLIYCFHHPELRRRFSILRRTLNHRSVITPKKGMNYQLPLRVMKLNDSMRN